LPPEEFHQVIKLIESFEDEKIENPIALHKIYGGSLETPIIIGSQESKEEASGIFLFQ
jgi:hypothetical protein